MKSKYAWKTKDGAAFCDAENGEFICPGNPTLKKKIEDLEKEWYKAKKPGFISGMSALHAFGGWLEDYHGFKLEYFHPKTDKDPNLVY